MLRICIFLKIISTIRAQFEGFIVGGVVAAIKKHPYSAFMLIECATDQGKHSYICCGSILNQKLLLTAAHCVHDCNTRSRISISMGDSNKEHGILRSAKGFIFHEKYDPLSSNNDIALVKMSKPVEFSSNVSRVAILKRPPYSEPALLAGWGIIDEHTHVYGRDLKVIEQNVWKRAACIKMFNVIPRGTICASSKTPTDYASSGDSGAGLVVRGYIQIGLVSYKSPTLADNVIVYTDVGYHYDWIRFQAIRFYCPDNSV